MIKVEKYTAKHADCSGDYKAAYEIVNSLRVGGSEEYSPDNQRVFRKYIYDLALKQNKEMATRFVRPAKVSIRVTRLS